ncbi:hypothetical protein GJ698_02845 [Pseudoduganella sp. FT26W]|uniref:ParB/Sulfiredoxin domain-containing protein n=1 Tax=Duganella aquatilis TaxID=2666082 RepID=A0A844CQL8_9BURK|nr:hypothetical protein [Duganella aquatilis]MRW83027.1 hypothetical protein [Duganella aquatilis]
MTTLQTSAPAPQAITTTDGAITMVLSRLPVSSIRIDGGTQSRVALHEPTVADYADVVRSGGELPPVVVFDDGAEIWLADGFHRYHGHNAAGVADIGCEIHFGTRRDAILYSAGANAAHGLRRTNDDKRRAVKTLLEDAEWSAWSNEAVARACRVSPHTVASVRGAISANAEMPCARLVERKGVTYQQNTANIGKAKSDGALPATCAEQKAAAPAGASVSPAEESEHVGPSDEEVAAALKAEADQLQYIRDLLVREGDPLTIALGDLAQARRLTAVLESQNAGHQATINQQIGIIKSLRKKLAKLEAGA